VGRLTALRRVALLLVLTLVGCAVLGWALGQLVLPLLSAEPRVGTAMVVPVLVASVGA
jgi:hypothetical protein